MDNVMRFESIELIEIPVELGDKKYVLREATGAVACKYRDALLSNTQMGSDGKASIKINNETEVLLVSLSIFETDGRPVSIATVKGWPSRIVKALYTKVKEISELDEKEAPKEEKKADESDSLGNELTEEKTPPAQPKNGLRDITDG